MKNLCEIKAGQTCLIKNVNGAGKTKLRLMELGFNINSVITVISVSALKKSFLLKVYDVIIALRSNIANIIEVEEVET